MIKVFTKKGIISVFLVTLQVMEQNKRKRSVTSRVLRTVLTLTVLPIIIMGMLVVALYIPPIQDYAIERICTVERCRCALFFLFLLFANGDINLAVGNLQLVYLCTLGCGVYGACSNSQMPYAAVDVQSVNKVMAVSYCMVHGYVVNLNLSFEQWQ